MIPFDNASTVLEHPIDVVPQISQVQASLKGEAGMGVGVDAICQTIVYRSLQLLAIRRVRAQRLQQGR